MALTSGVETSTRSEDSEVVSLAFASAVLRVGRVPLRAFLRALAGLFFCLLAGPALASGYAAALSDYQVGRYDTAYQGFMTAVAKGDERGRYYIAMMYKDGLGVRQDLGEALTWFGCAAGSRAPMAVSAGIWRDLLRASLPASVIQQVRVDGRSCSGTAAAVQAVEEQLTYREVLSPTPSTELSGSVQGQSNGGQGRGFERVLFWPVDMALRAMGRAVEGLSGERVASVRNARPSSPQGPSSVAVAAFCWVVLALAAIGLRSTLGGIANRRRRESPAPSL